MRRSPRLAARAAKFARSRARNEDPDSFSSESQNTESIPKKSKVKKEKKKVIHDDDSRKKPKNPIPAKRWIIYRNTICGTSGILILSLAFVIVVTISIPVRPPDVAQKHETKKAFRGDTLINNPIWRLPKEVHPIAYDLTLRPDLDADSYSGIVNITINVTSPKNEIILNSFNLGIEKVTLYSIDKNNFIDVGYFEHSAVPKSSLIEHLLVRPIEDRSKYLPMKGMYFLLIQFNGTLKNKYKAFYKDQYAFKEPINHMIYRDFAASMFEPIYARRTFPCFDEPHLKAKFHLHIEIPKNDKNYSVLTNFPLESKIESKNGIMHHFQASNVVMSTYLLCFVISDFKNTTTYYYKNDHNKTRVLIDVYSRPLYGAITFYAGDIARQVLPFYESYFETTYPFNKLEIVAIPELETPTIQQHWGLITSGEPLLLLDQHYHGSRDKQNVVMAVAEALAQNWFGSLVTVKWWDSIWLQEGIASYLKYYAVNYTKPEWDIHLQFIAEELHPALELDAMTSTRPLIESVVTPDDIEEVFDGIAYHKGACIMRMFEDLVRSPGLKYELPKLIKMFSYGSISTQNFSETFGVNTDKFINHYLNQSGYPLITIEYSGNEFKLTQNRFILDNSIKHRYKETWTIQLIYLVLGKNSTLSTTFWHNEPEVILDPHNEIIKLNPQQRGYYRVNYPKDYWSKLIENYEKFDVADRAHLIEESFSLAEAGELSYDIPLGFTYKLASEIHYLPWKGAESKLIKLKKFLNRSYDEFITEVVAEMYDFLYWEDRPLLRIDRQSKHLRSLARIVVLNLACYFGNADCIHIARERYVSWFHGGPNLLHKDLGEVIFKYGVTDDHFERPLKSYYRIMTDETIKIKLLKGLANVKNVTLIKEYLDWIKKNNYKCLSCLEYISDNNDKRINGAKLVWNHITSNWKELVNKYNVSESSLSKVIRTVSKSFTTSVDYKKVEDFVKDHKKIRPGKKARNEALEIAKNNFLWMKRNSTKEIYRWINQWKSRHPIKFATINL